MTTPGQRLTVIGLLFGGALIMLGVFGLALYALERVIR